MQLSKTVLQHSSPLWSCSQSHPSRDTPTTFPISFPLPTYARWSSSLLPPTTRFTRGNFKLTISYQVSIQLTRRGRLRRDERIVTEFAYAPRTIPDVGPSIGNSFRIDTTNTTGMDENKPSGAVRWKAANLQPLTAVDDPLPILVRVFADIRKIRRNLLPTHSHSSISHHLQAIPRGHQSLSGSLSRHRTSSALYRQGVCSKAQTPFRSSSLNSCHSVLARHLLLSNGP